MRPTDLHIIDQIRTLAREGMSTREIARLTGLGQSTVHQYVRDMKLTYTAQEHEAALRTFADEMKKLCRKWMGEGHPGLTLMAEEVDATLRHALNANS